MASIFDGLSLADDAPLPAAPVPPPVPPLGPPGRRIDDVSATRKAIYDSVLSSFRGLVPATNTRYSLRLDNLDYEDPDEVSLKDQKAAILHGRTVSRRLRGDWVLADTDGLEVERKRATVAQVPYLTPRGTYIVNGSEYTLANQLRLRPGVFTRRKENGEVESHLNTLPGQGMSHRYLLDPETGRFQAQFGQAKLPLLPILRAVGATDDELRASWGDELLSANLKKDDPKGLDQVYAKLLPRGDQRIDAVAKRQAVAAYMAKMGFDPAVNARTLGSPYAALSKDAMLSTTAKLLAVSRGESEPDDRDHLANQMFLGAEDLYAERAKRAGPALSRLLWQATYSKSLRRVQPNALTSQVQGALLDSGLGNPLEEVNAADVYDQLSRVTRLGTGGISSLDSIPLDSRSVQPSHFGYIDPIRTPESLKAGVDGRMTADVRKGDNGVLYSRFKDRTGNDQWLTPEQVAGSPVALPGELEKDDKYVAAVRGGRVDMVDRDEVTHELPTFDGLFSGVANLVPFRTGNKGQRLAMGSRFITQALPLIGAEAPLVRSAGPGGASYDEMYGDRFGAVRAETDGRVQSVDKDGVTVKYADGRTETHQLYNTQPYNRKTMINSTSLVQPGDAVKPGQLLAHSNFTDDTGTLALGRNLRTAYLPYKGLAYEDAMVISESAAKKLTSQHLYQHETEFDADAKRGKKAYVSIFPARFDRRVLDTMDDDGAVQPGTVVQPGDPLVLAASPRELTHKQVHSAHKGTFRDQSDTWEHHVPGTVTDVAKTKKGIVVTVVSHMPMVEADKLCYDPATEVLTAAGWKPVAAVTTADAVATLNPETGVFEYLKPVATQSFPHVGTMYSLASTQVDLLVTENHHLYAKRRYAAEYALLEAGTLVGKTFRLKRDADWVGASPEAVTLPALVVPAGQYGHGQRAMPPVAVPVDTYAMLLGMFLSEGSTFFHQDSGSYGFSISQMTPGGVAAMLPALDRCGVKYNRTEGGVRVYGKQWAEHLKPLGLCYQKRIPSEVFAWDKPQLRTLFDWLMWGDGCKGRTSWRYFTTSPGLADDVQRLCLHLGMSGNVTRRDGHRGTIKGKEYDFRDLYDVSIYRHKNAPQIGYACGKKPTRQKQEMVPYDGMVHCVTMPKWHVIYVRRNGKPVWCGNSGRYGDKGTVSKIVPDEHMPQDAEGRPFELILNPLGIISRANPGQVYEALLGKVAAKTGKPFTIPDIGGKGDWTEMVQAELTKHGLSDTETVVDPTTGRKIPGVLTGVRYAYKLLHTSESKDQGRGLGAYTADDVPAKTGGADGSSKRLALMDSHALLSSGATEVLRDAKLIRGQKNQQYWSDFMAGNRPGTPDVPFVYRKFVERLRGSGINVVRDGTKSHLYALTNDDVDDLAGDRELKNADTVNWEDGLKPIPGGLFDPALTGGHGAAGRWSFIRLTEPMPSPVMEDPIKRVLGLTGPRFEAVLAGKEKLGELTGPRAIQAALTAVDMDQAIAQARADVKSGRAGVRDAAVRRLGFLAGARKSGIHPKQWMWSKLPVLPPAFRPVSMMQRTGSPLVADANYGYREVFEANANLSELKDRVADVGAERSALYGAMKAVVGLGDPIQPKNQERQVRGLLQHVFGWNPKQGTVQQQLLGGGTDMVGRAVAVPDPDLSLDEVGLPEARAWTVYSPFVVRRLVRDGVPRLQAMQYAKDRTPLALKALLAEMDTRPVIVTRAPVLHRYGELAFMPKLVKGDSIHTNPSIVQGYGLDYDGDQHVGSVLVSIPSGIDGVCESITVEGGSTASYASHLMPFSANLGIPTLDDGHALHVFNLEDFPHGAHTCVSQGRFGSVDWYHVPPGIKVLAYDETTGAAKWADVTIWSRHTGCPVEIVELRSGRQIVTDDDPRAVYGIPAGELALTRTTPTDALARRFLVPRIVAIAETDTPVREVRMGSDTGTGHHRRANLKDVAELTHSFGYLLGALAGDGWVAGNSRGVSELKDVVLAGITKAVVDKADAAIAELFVTAPPRKCSVVSTESYGQSERHTWTSIELAEFVAPMIGRGAANKHLPPWFLSAPRECREGLFAGLMDTDGSIAVSGAKKKPQLMANYSSNSLRLVRETQLLAMSIDIRGRITASKTPAGNVCWMLSFSNLDVAKWNGRGMTHPAKLLALTKAKPSETGSGAVRHDLVPLSFALAKALRLAVYKGKTKTGPWESPQQNSAYSALTAACKTGHAPRQTVRFSLAFRPAFTHPDLDACRRIVDNVAVTWEPVVAVEKTGVTETGYDLTVPGYETFASADGVILSNTMNYHVPASDEARDEALAKLLPSRNLLSVKSFKADNFVPRQEYLAGLHAASTKRDPLKTRRTFATTAAAVRAYYNGELDVDTPVEILDQPANKDKK